MQGIYSKVQPNFCKATLSGLLLVTLLWFASSEARAQSYLMPDSEVMADVVEHIVAGDAERAEHALDALPASAKDADYHYLRGVLSMQAMNDVGALRMARLARRMKGHLEDAVDTDPDHALAHFGLMQFHRFAPGIMGGRERKLEFHYQRLIELDSFLQFPAAIVKTQVEEDEMAQREVHLNWIAHSPQMFEAHYAYLTSLIDWADYDQANTAAVEAFRHADDQQTQLIQYQQVRMAALAGLSEDPAEASQQSKKTWFAEAYTTGLALLANESRSEQVDQAWLNMRLAQVEWAMDDVARAQTRVEQVLAAQPEERLEEQAIALQRRLNEGN